MDRPSDPVITLQIRASMSGVQVSAEGDLSATNDAATVAATLCRFAEGLYVGGQNVQLDPAIVRAVL